MASCSSSAFASRTRASLIAENALLRQQLIVVMRSTKVRGKIMRLDRAILVALDPCTQNIYQQPSTNKQSGMHLPQTEPFGAYAPREGCAQGPTRSGGCWPLDPRGSLV